VNGTATYKARLRDTQTELTGAVEAWIENVKAQLRLLQITAGGRVEPGGTLKKTYHLTKGLTEANVQYVQDVARASLGLWGGVRTSAAQAANAVKDDALLVANSTAASANLFEDDVVKATAELGKNQRAQARQAKRAAHDATVEQYENMTKVELSEELGDRGLKKSGKVDELRERLIDADLEDA
jgi:hypothetical protein